MLFDADEVWKRSWTPLLWMFMITYAYLPTLLHHHCILFVVLVQAKRTAFYFSCLFFFLVSIFFYPFPFILVLVLRCHFLRRFRLSSPH